MHANIEKPTKKTARIVGTLFLISYAGVFIGSEISGSVIDSDPLLNAYPDRGQLNVGVLVEMINEVAIVGIAVLLYPLLRKVSEGVALFYVGLRVLEAGFLMMAKVSSLSLVDVSEDFLAAGTTDTSTYEAASSLAIAQRDAAFYIGAIAFIVGGIALYYLLLRSELVPRFISIWGLLAIGSLIVANALGTPDVTEEFGPAVLLYLPIILNELFLAGWLLVKGFTPPEDKTKFIKPTQRELTYVS